MEQFFLEKISTFQLKIFDESSSAENYFYPKLEYEFFLPVVNFHKVMGV